MRLQMLTAFGLATLDASFDPAAPALASISPIEIIVDHDTSTTITELPVRLPDIAAAAGHELWIHDGRVSPVPPVGPIGVDIGVPSGLFATLSSDPVTVYHPVVIDFEVAEHAFPLNAGTKAEVRLSRGPTEPTLWDETIVATQVSNSSLGSVILSASKLGLYTRITASSSPAIVLPHDANSVHEVTAVLSTLLITTYLAIIAGYASNKKSSMLSSNNLNWIIVALDGPVCAIGIIFSSAVSHEGSDAWNEMRRWSLIAISVAGIVLAVLPGTPKSSERERRLIEPALLVALQAPFVDRLGILAQLLAGIGASAVASRNIARSGRKSISPSQIVDIAFALAVSAWMGPLLVRTAVVEALQTTDWIPTFLPSLATTLATATISGAF